MSLSLSGASSLRRAFSLAQTLVAVSIVAILATAALWAFPQWRARSASAELVAAARAASLGELTTRTFETVPAGAVGASGATITGGSDRVETIARWSDGDSWGVVLTHAWDRSTACVATSAEPTPRCGAVEPMAQGDGGAAPTGVAGSLTPMSRSAAEQAWPTLLAGRTIPAVPQGGGLVVADARGAVTAPWTPVTAGSGSAETTGTEGGTASDEQTAWVTWRQGTIVLQSKPASDTSAAVLVAAVADDETPVELWLVSTAGRVRANGSGGGTGGSSSGTPDPFSVSNLTPVAGEAILLDGRPVRVGSDSARAWNWTFGTTIIPASSSVQNLVRFPVPGTYTITLSTRLQSGQVVVQSRTVTVGSGGGTGGGALAPRPRAVLTSTATFVAPNQAITLSLVQSSTPASGGITSYRFVNGAGVAQAGASTSLTTLYRTAGTYTALGIITDAAGVVDTARLTITVASGGAPFDGARSSLSVLPLSDRQVGGEARVLPVVAKLVDVNGLVRGGVVPTVTVAPIGGTAVTATASAFTATNSSTGEATGSLTVPSLAPGVSASWALSLRTGGSTGPLVRVDTVTFTGVSNAVAAPLPLVGRLAVTTDIPVGTPVVSGQPIAPAVVAQIRSLDGTSNLAVEGVPVTVVFQQGNGTLAGATAFTDGTGRVVLPALSLTGVAGSYQLALSADGYVPATTRVFDLLTALEGSRLMMLQQPALTMIRGQTNVVQPSVRLLNADGSPAQIPGVSVAALVAASTARGGTTLTAATAVTDGAGVATFSSLRLNGLPGLVTLRFAANGYQPVVARSIQVNAPAPYVSLDTAWAPTLFHGQASSVTPVITLRDIQDRIVGTAGATGGSGTGVTVTITPSPNFGDVSLGTASASTTAGVARLADFRAYGTRPVSRLFALKAAGYDSTTFAVNVAFPTEGGATGLRWQLVSGAPTAPVPAGTPIGPVVLQLVDAANAPVAAAGYPAWLGATGGRTLVGQDTRGRAGGALTDATGRVTLGLVTLQGAIGPTSLVTRGRESWEDGVGKNLPQVTLPVTLVAGAPTTATRSGTAPLTATAGVALAPITIQLRDASGNAVAEAGATVTLTATGGVTFAAGSATATTDANGVATIAAAIPQGLTGTVSLSASISRDAAQVAASGGAPTLSPALGSLSLVGIPVATVESRAPTNFVPSGGTFATALQVQLRDGGNRAVPMAGVSITLAIDSTGESDDERASAIAAGGTAVTDASGTATFSGLVLTGSGRVRLSATAPAVSSISANAPTLLPTAIQIAPAPVAALAITAAPTSGAVNSDLAALTVELRDASGNRVPEAGRVVTLSLDATTGWSGAISGTTSRTTDAAGRVTFAGLRLIGPAPASGSGAPRLVASLTGATSAMTSALDLAPGRFASVTLLSAPDTLFIDVAAPIVAQLRDVAGNATADAPGDYRLTFEGGGVSHQEGLRHAGFSTGSGGTGQATFTLMPRLAGLSAATVAPVRAFTFYGEQPSCTGCPKPAFTGSRPVRPGPARQIVVSQQPASQQVGAPIASVLRLMLQDASGNAPTGGPDGLGTPLSGHALTLAVATSLTPGRTIESVAGQSSDLTALTDATGVASFPANTLRLTGPTGAVRLLGSGQAPLTGVAGTAITGTAGTAVALQWVVNPPARGRIGVGLTAMSVRAIDAYGNVVVSPTRSITLEPMDAGYTLAGATATTTGSGTAGFGALVATGPRGNLTLRATSTGLTPAVAPAPMDLSSGAPAALQLVRGLPATLSVDAPVATHQSLQVQLVDAGGFPVYESGRTLTLVLPGSSSIPAGRTVTTNASGLADFGGTRVRGVAPATLTGGSVTDANGLPALALGSLTLTPGTATQFTLLSPLPTTVSPGQAISPAFRAQLRDVSGNAVAVSGRQLAFFAPDGSSGDGYPSSPLVTALTDGSGVATFTPTIPNAWLPPVGQALVVRVQAIDFTGGTGNPNFNQTTPVTLTVSAGSATQIGIVSAPSTVTVDQPFGATVTDSVIAQIRDADGNPVSLAGRTATLTLPDGATGALTGPTLTAVSSSTGRLAFPLNGRRYLGLSGARPWTVTAAAGTPSLTAGTRAVTVTPGAPVSLAVTTPPSDTAAIGLALARQPVIEARDAAGNRATSATGLLVTIYDPEATGVTLAGTTATMTNGVATFSSLALTGSLGTYRLAATTTFTDTPVVVELPGILLGIGPASQITFVSGFSLPASLGIGVTTLGEARLQLRDAAGNAAPQSGVNVTATLIAGPGGTLGGTRTRPTSGTGLAIFADLTLSGIPGAHVIEFATSTFSVRDTVTIPVGLMSPAQSTLTASPTTITASNATSPSIATFTLTARDNTGTPRPNQSVRITLSGTAASGATITSGSPLTTNAQGVATFTVRSTRAGTLTATGANDNTGQTVNQTASVTVLADAAVAANTTITLSRTTIQPTGTDTSLATVTVVDAFNNPVPGAGVVLTASPSANITLPAEGTTNSLGQTSLALTATDDVTATIGVLVNGTPATQTATLSSISTGPGGVTGSLQTWLRADTGVVTAGGLVTSWGWRGPAAVSAPGVTAPTWSATGLNGRPAIIFAGNQGLRIPNITLGAHTVFTVFRMTGPTSAGLVWEHSSDYNAGNGSFLGGSNNTTTGVSRSNLFSRKNMASATWAGDNVPRIATVRWAGTHASQILRLNGVAQTLGSNGSSAAGTAAFTADLFLGHRNLNAQFRMDGAIAEVVAYNRSLSDAEVLAVEQELAARWSLALPTASFTATAGSGTTVNFNAIASTAPMGVSSYAWDFGDLTTGSGISLTRTYAVAGAYSVTLVVTDALGRTASVTQPVNVGGEPGGVTSGLLLWARADVGGAVAEGAAVNAWPSIVGPSLANGAVGAVTQGPVFQTTGFNGRPTFAFSTGRGLRTTGNLALGPQTIITVMRGRAATESAAGFIWEHGPSTSAVYGSYLNGGNNATMGFTRSPGGSSGTSSRNVNSPALWAADATPRLVTTRYIGANATHTIWFNGVQNATGAGSWGTTNIGASVLTQPLYLGYRQADGGGSWAWDLSEVLVYNRDLTATERAAIERDLANRWGLLLPAPTASFTARQREGSLTVDVDASTTTAAQGVSSYAWDFGDLTSGTGVTTSRTYTATGTYSITLTVTDLANRTSTSTQSVDVTVTGTFAPLYWFRADRGLTMATDSTVSAWANQGSVVGSATQSTSTNRPRLSGAAAIGGLPTLRFGSGTTNPNHFLTLPTTPAALSGGATYLAVFRPRGWPTEGVTHRIISMTSSPTSGNERVTVALFTNSAGGVPAGSLAYSAVQGTGTVGGFVAASPNVALETPLVYSIVQEGSGAVTLRRNGVVFGTGTVPLPLSVSRAGGWIGGAWTTEARPAMDLAELIVINRPLSNAERASLEADVQSRWGPMP